MSIEPVGAALVVAPVKGEGLFPVAELVVFGPVDRSRQCSVAVIGNIDHHDHDHDNLVDHSLMH